MDCLFCKIVSGEVPSKKLYEDDLVIAIMDAYPTVDGHVLIIPKKHFTDIMEIDNDILIHINNIAKELTPLLMKKLNKNAISYCVNYGESQAIKHYHYHLMPELQKYIKNYEVDDVFNKLNN